MRRSHPLWRGFFLAAAMAACLYLLGGVDSLPAYALNRRALVFAIAAALGSAIASVPRRLRKQRPAGQRPTWQRCVKCLLCGAAMALGLGMCGSAGVLSALMTGSVGAYGFCVSALAAGFITVRIAGRRAGA